MITLERITELAADLRREGVTAIADDLTGAQEGVFSGTELAMKWRFLLGSALEDARLTSTTRREVQEAWADLNSVLSQRPLPTLPGRLGRPLPGNMSDLPQDVGSATTGHWDPRGK